MRKNPILRTFQKTDLEAVRALIHRTIDAAYTGVDPPRAVVFFKQYYSKEKILERSRDGEIVVLACGGKAVAMGSILEGEICGVFVDLDFQRAGFGVRLMQELERRVSASGRKEAELSVSLPSRGFYERLGYTVLEACSIDVGEGEQLKYWKAKKTLGKA